MPAVKPAVKKPLTRGNSPTNTSPNTILVVFLVIFVLTSIGLGVWGYYAQAGQEELRKDAIRKSKEAQNAQKLADLYAFATSELRQAVGQPLEAEEQAKWEVGREDIMKENGKYQGEALRPIILGLIQEMKKDLATKELPGFNTETKKYDPPYKERLAALAAKLKVAEGLAAAKITEATNSNELYSKLTDADNKFRKAALDLIRDGNAKALAGLADKFKYTEEQFRVNKVLRDEISKNTEDWGVLKENFERNIAVLQEKLENASKVKAAPPVAAPNPKKEDAPAGELHSLVLDISRGKASWDTSVGRVLSVIDGKQVIISLGSEDNIKPQLSFNVFLAGAHGRPDREMKGTIEVVRAIDGKTALANITSQSNKEFPITKEDVLFNPFFGAHVAVAGQINWFAAGGARGESADEQIRSLNQFMQLLKNQGVVIDAYVDLNNGAIKGTIDSRTRYLIRGDNLYPKAPAKEEVMEKKEEEKKEEKEPAKDKDADKEKDKEPEKKDKDAGDAKPMPEAGGEDLKVMNAKRIQTANESIKTMVQQATENGCFVISAANFAVVTGYRRLVTTVAAPEAPFRPRLPAFNVVPDGGAAPPPAAPKKEPAEKAAA